jgi:hypothetical protein
MYKVVQIWPGQTVTCLHTISPGHIWTTLYICVHVKYPLFLLDFNETWIFSPHFRKTLKYQISWKSVKWDLTSFMRTGGRTDWRTDMTKLTVAFRDFVNAPTEGGKNYKVVQIWPGQTVTCLHTNSPGHIWTTLYKEKRTRLRKAKAWFCLTTCSTCWIIQRRRSVDEV